MYMLYQCSSHIDLFYSIIIVFVPTKHTQKQRGVSQDTILLSDRSSVNMHTGWPTHHGRASETIDELVQSVGRQVRTQHFQLPQQLLLHLSSQCDGKLGLHILGCILHPFNYLFIYMYMYNEYYWYMH